MTTAKKSSAVLTITVKDGTCSCGCGAALKGKSRYAQGHDMKLRSKLGQAVREGQMVAMGGKTLTAAQMMTEHGFPVPTIAEPKPQATPTATTRKRTTRKPKA